MAGLDDLEPQDRAVVELLLDKGQSYGQIARTLELPEERVRAFARNAVGQLRDSGGGDEDDKPPSAATVIPVFALYMILIFAGLAYFIVIGLEHH
jgi:hypothetical protein